MKTITFYTTEACSLCDKAYSIIEVCIKKDQFDLQVIDIADTDDLIEKFGDKIPLLYRSDTETTLFWPFSPPDVQNFLSS